MYEIDTEKIHKLKPSILQADKIVLIGHTSPDGDAVSSVLALYLALKKITQAEVFPVLPDRVPNYVNWFDHVQDLIIGEQAGKLLLSCDMIFCCDFNEAKRVSHLSEYLLKSKAIKVMIDHHPQPEENLVDYLFSYPSASSAAEIVYSFLKALDQSVIDKTIATYLFSGILTDTGVFVHDSADSQTLAIASELLSYGIDKGKIIRNLFNNYSENRMRLMGYLLYKNMKIFYDYHVGIITLSRREMKRFDFTLGDHESLANLPLSIKDVEISIFIMERSDELKVSLRSKGHYDVNLIARDYFHGGGHKNAAGGSFTGSLHQIRRYIKKNLLPNLKKYLV